MPLGGMGNNVNTAGAGAGRLVGRPSLAPVPESGEKRSPAVAWGAENAAPHA